MLVLASCPVQPPPLMKMMMMMMTIKEDPPKHQRYRPLSQPFLATDQVVFVPLSTHVRDSVLCVWDKIYRELCWIREHGAQVRDIARAWLPHVSRAHLVLTFALVMCLWMETIETVFNECGMSNVWQTQCQGISTRWLKEAVKARLQYQFVQRTDKLINVNSKCFLYKDTKQDHKFERL